MTLSTRLSFFINAKFEWNPTFEFKFNLRLTIVIKKIIDLIQQFVFFFHLMIERTSNGIE